MVIDIENNFLWSVPERVEFGIMQHYSIKKPFCTLAAFLTPSASQGRPLRALVINLSLDSLLGLPGGTPPGTSAPEP